MGVGRRAFERHQVRLAAASANFSEEAWREFRALRESDLKTARSWALKETAMRLFDYRRESAARAFCEQWRGWASRSRLTPMVAVARMLTARLNNILYVSETPHYERRQ